MSETPKVNLASLAPSSTLLLINETAATLMSFSGKTERLTYEDFQARYATATLPAEGSQAANGAIAYLHLPLTTSTGAVTVSPDRKNTAQLGTPQRDGAAVILLSRHGAAPEKIVLRLPPNKPLKDATLLGWFDAQTMIAAARDAGDRFAYAVSLDGIARPLVKLPENLIYLQGRSGILWYATAEMGEGLETPPAGPSELHRISLDGRDELVVREEKDVVLSAVSVPGSCVAYTTDANQSFCLIEGSKIEVGKRRPLMFVGNRFLVLRDKFDLVLFDLQTSTSQKIGALPEGGVDVFVLPL